MQISKQVGGWNQIEFAALPSAILATGADDQPFRWPRCILRRFLMIMLGMLFPAIPVACEAAELKAETVRTWDAYVEMANLQMRERAQKTFLWVDESPERLQRVRDGEILVSSVGPQNPKPVASGLIHDWIGAAFIPHVRINDVVAAARDYDHYKNFYQPNIVNSKGLGTSGNCDKYSMRVVNKAVVAETALDAEYMACYLRLDANRWYSTGYTTRLQEVRSYGRSDEQDLPPGQGSGYLWRLYSIARFEERDGGVYVELEAIALSRDIPVALRWMVSPLVRNVSKSAMLTSLQQMADAARSTADGNRDKPFTLATARHVPARASKPK